MSSVLATCRVGVGLTIVAIQPQMQPRSGFWDALLASALWVERALTH